MKQSSIWRGKIIISKKKKKLLNPRPGTGRRRSNETLQMMEVMNPSRWFVATHGHTYIHSYGQNKVICRGRFVPNQKRYIFGINNNQGLRTVHWCDKRDACGGLYVCHQGNTARALASKVSKSPELKGMMLKLWTEWNESKYLKSALNLIVLY